MRIIRSGAVAALAVTALALSACAGGATPATTETAVDDTPVAGGDLTFAVANDPISLNPSGTGSGNDTLYVTRQLVDSLLYQQVADQLDAFVQQDGADGVVIGSHVVPSGLDEFVDRVVPLLQERGSLRTEYTGTTLRDNLGLPVPERAAADAELAGARA